MDRVPVQIQPPARLAAGPRPLMRPPIPGRHLLARGPYVTRARLGLAPPADSVESRPYSSVGLMARPVPTFSFRDAAPEEVAHPILEACGSVAVEELLSDRCGGQRVDGVIRENLAAVQARRGLEAPT